MVRFIKDCVGCTDIGLPCMGQGCTQGYMEMTCDCCGRDADILYLVDSIVNGGEYCKDCALETLEKMEEDEENDEAYLVDGEWLVDVDALDSFEKIEF